MANDNKEVGRFDLSDIPPAPRGMPQIEVSFDIDADGILHVSAKDLSSGKQQKIRIEAASGLTEEEIKRKIRDAEEHAEEDKKRKEEVEVKNEADALVFRAEKALKDYGDKVPKEVANDIQQKVDALKKALETSDLNRIKTARQDLEQHMQKIGEAMAQAQQQAQPGQQQGAQAEQPHHEHSSEKPDDAQNIEDAEVEIIDDNKK
jgi:molecular chaperone DnaK